MFDLLIHNGWIVDGSGAPRYRGNVAVSGGRVAAIVRPGAVVASRQELDVSGCVVTPGFVDMHSHADMGLPILPTADSLVHQGITTVVTGNCGETRAPLLPETREAVIASMTSDDTPLPWSWSSFESYLNHLRGIGLSLNMVPLVGQGTIRNGVMGYTSAAPNAKQMERMKAEVTRAMAEGAIGLSTGLIYPPGSYATTEELVELARPVGERGGYYFSHIRGEGHTLLEAVAEAIRIGRETGAAVEIGHFKAAGQVNWSKAVQALGLIDSARAEGLDVTMDMYPYVAGSSSLVSMLPEWAQEGGKAATLARLGDPVVRARMIEAMGSEGFFRIAAWETVLIAGCPRNPSYEGCYVGALAEEAGKSPYDWVFDALLETSLQIQMIMPYAGEENLRRQLVHPEMMVGTDSAVHATTGLLSSGYPHPRGYGTFPRILGRFVREEGVIPLEEAIHKMSGLPARKLRWADRGLLKDGYAADIVVFDPQTVIDCATFEKPHQYPEGIRHVLVNGQFVVRDGEHTGARPGQVLGRG
jgi:N-acyl-D-amino-acid deacylase